MVDVLGFEVHFVARLGDVHEQVSILRSESVGLEDQINEMVVLNGDVPIFSRFTRKGEHSIVTTFSIIAFDVLHMHGLQGRQTVGFVGLCIFIGPNTDVVQVHQTDHEG